MEALIDGFFNLQILSEALPYLASGLAMTLLLSLVAIPLGGAAGLALTLASTSRLRAVRWSAIWRHIPSTTGRRAGREP